MPLTDHASHWFEKVHKNFIELAGKYMNHGVAVHDKNTEKCNNQYNAVVSNLRVRVD